MYGVQESRCTDWAEPGDTGNCAAVGSGARATRLHVIQWPFVNLRTFMVFRVTIGFKIGWFKILLPVFK